MGDNKLNINEIADYLECSKNAIEYLVGRSHIPYEIISSKIMFDKNIIDRWLYDNQISKIEEIIDEIIVTTYDTNP